MKSVAAARESGPKALEVMKRLKFDPVEGLIGILREEVEMPGGEVESWQYQDWEMGLNGKLRVRRKLAVEIMKELAGYGYGKAKGEGGKVAVGVAVVIRDAGNGVAVPEHGRGDEVAVKVRGRQ